MEDSNDLSLLVETARKDGKSTNSSNLEEVSAMSVVHPPNSTQVAGDLPTTEDTSVVSQLSNILKDIVRIVHQLVGTNVKLLDIILSHKSTAHHVHQSVHLADGITVVTTPVA
jgi:hypothetical protein